MNNKFFSILNPLLDLIDNGRFFYKPLKYFYYFMALVSVILPIYMLFVMIDSRIYDYLSEMRSVLIITWMLFAAVGVVVALIFVNRASKIDNEFKDFGDYVAVPIFAHLIRTVGEVVGISFAIFFTASGFLSLLFAEKMRTIDQITGGDLPFLGVSGLFIAVFIGYLITLFTRFISEQMKAIIEIAQNSKNLKKQNTDQGLDDLLS